MFRKSLNNQNFMVIDRKNHFMFKDDFKLRDRLLLYFSKAILVFGFLIIFLNSLDFFTPYVGINSGIWEAWIIFFLGSVINFFCVPFLYLSSFNKFKNSDDYWDVEIFWILPLFFFGSFFQYMSNLSIVSIILPFSLILIFLVHAWSMLVSRNVIINEDSQENENYFKSYVYLTAYYLLVAVFSISFDLFGTFKYWMQ